MIFFQDHCQRHARSDVLRPVQVLHGAGGEEEQERLREKRERGFPMKIIKKAFKS